MLSSGYSVLFAGSITGTTPANLSLEIVADTAIDFVYTPAIDYANASCELLITVNSVIYPVGINTTVYNATSTTMYANSSYTVLTYQPGITWLVNCTNTTHYLTSAPLQFAIDVRGTYETKLTDLGNGLGNFLDAISNPTANFILLLAIIGGVVAIFLGVVFAIKAGIISIR